MSGETDVSAPRSRSGRKLYPAVPLADRLWSRVDKSGEHWLWTGHVMKNGYGQISRGRSTGLVTTHRAAWEVTYGPIPEGLFVCHHCDTPPCVRPDHLFLGTPQDNIVDMVNKGREVIFRGLSHAMGVLSDGQVREIRARVASGEKQTALAPEYGVTPQFVGQIARRVRRAYVED